MSQKPPETTVIIINYNGRAYLDELLQTLKRQSVLAFETLLIDNASSDQSAAYVRHNYPWVQVLPQSVNLGFSRAGNLGAGRSRARYLAFLNTDMKLDPLWLEGLMEEAGNDSRNAAVASKIRLYDRPRLLNGVGGAMNRLGYTWDRGMFEEDSGQYDRSEEVFFASAGAALFRRSAFLEAGGFDESFFMYHEDVDLCWRLWLFGFRIITAPDSVAYHHFGGTTRNSQGMFWRETLGERHSMRSLIKNYEAGNMLQSLFQIFLLRQSARRKLAQFRNFLWNLQRLPDTLGHRRIIQKRRRRTDQDLKSLIVQSPNVPIRI